MNHHYVLQAIGLAWIILLTLINWLWFDKLKWKTGPFFHIIFGAIWFTPVFIVGWIWQHDIHLIIVLIIQRFVFFNPLLNIERGKTFFYLSTQQGESSSLWDELEIRYANIYRDIWYVSTVIYFAQFFIH